MRSGGVYACAAESGNGNLMDLTIKATRLRATVGEISDAMENVFGRFRAGNKPFPACTEALWKVGRLGSVSRPISPRSPKNKAVVRAS